MKGKERTETFPDTCPIPATSLIQHPFLGPGSTAISILSTRLQTLGVHSSRNILGIPTVRTVLGLPNAFHATAP